MAGDCATPRGSRLKSGGVYPYARRSAGMLIVVEERNCRHRFGTDLIVATSLSITAYRTCLFRSLILGLNSCNCENLTKYIFVTPLNSPATISITPYSSLNTASRWHSKAQLSWQTFPTKSVLSLTNYALLLTTKTDHNRHPLPLPNPRPPPPNPALPPHPRPNPNHNPHPHNNPNLLPLLPQTKSDPRMLPPLRQTLHPLFLLRLPVHRALLPHLPLNLSFEQAPAIARFIHAL